MSHPKTMLGAKRKGLTVLRYRTDEGCVIGWIVGEGPKRLRFYFAGEQVERYISREEARYMTEIGR